MGLNAANEYRYIGETRGSEDHDHDLVHELSKRLDALWHFDQYIANAEKRPVIQDFWREVKRQEIANVKRLKELIASEIKAGCF